MRAGYDINLPVLSNFKNSQPFLVTCAKRDRLATSAKLEGSWEEERNEASLPLPCSLPPMRAHCFFFLVERRLGTRQGMLNVTVQCLLVGIDH